MREAIQPREILDALKAPEDGALVVFDGFVRNNFKGRQTLYLEYETYKAMALAEDARDGAEIRAKFPVHRIAIVRPAPARLSRSARRASPVGVSSPHRAAAFDACRYAIDTLKRCVPI